MIFIIIPLFLYMSCGTNEISKVNLIEEIHQVFQNHQKIDKYASFGKVTEIKIDKTLNLKTTSFELDDNRCPELFVSQNNSDEIVHVALSCELGRGLLLSESQIRGLENWQRKPYEGSLRDAHFDFKRYYIKEPNGPRSILMSEGVEDTIKMINWNR